MNYKMMGRFLSQILFLEAAFMIPALLIAVFCREQKAIYGFLAGFAVTVVLAALLHLGCRNAVRRFQAREGLVCVGMGWIVMSVVGCLPFYVSGEIPHYIDALFEIVSGFTTTGASILPEVEPLSRSILYWRSFSHWLGGMGVLVFLLAVSGHNNGFTMHILRAESPGPDVGKLVPRMRQTAQILYLLYILLTVLNVVFLVAGRMPLFDAVCTAFGTAGTGGYGIKNDSMAGYSPYLQNVTTVFMLLFGVNFSCYYLLLMKRVKSVFKDEELRLYLGIMAGSIVLIYFNIRPLFESTGEAIRHTAFQVASIMTTTGFATTDFDLWPSFSKSILLFLMIVGACAGSTAGGLKCGRVLLLLKSLRRNIRKTLNPQKVQVVRNNGHMVSEHVLDNVNAYLAAYVVILLASFIVISLDGFSVETNVSAVLACFNNTGPGLGAVGPTCNYSGYGILSKLVLIVDMLAGRLEIFPVLILASGSTWRRR